MSSILDQNRHGNIKEDVKWGLGGEIRLTTFVPLNVADANGNLIINHEYPNPKTIIERLDDTHYKYIISSIVKHCMSESVNFDERLNKLLKQL